MKKILLITILSISPLSSKMIYDPVSNLCYSDPVSEEINLNEYNQLIIRLVMITNNMIYASGIVNKKIIKEAHINFLMRIGSVTAKRLINDLETGVIYSENGSQIRNIY